VAPGGLLFLVSSERALLDRLKAKQQKAHTVPKLWLMALKEISNSQLELIRLTEKVVGSLDQYWANIDTIQHVLLVCEVAERQVSVMESVMQAAMGGHMSVTAFTELNYARIALKIGREAKDVGLQLVARHLSDYLQMEMSFVAGSEGFSTLVYVPLIDMKSALTIFEHHILPIPLEDCLYLNIGPADYIALKIGREAKDVGLQPVARHLSDYLQMEMSFVAGSEGFSTLVHVPLIDMKSALTIGEHHILPIPLEDCLYHIIGPDNYRDIAVTADHKLYRAMVRAELNTCRRVGEFYLCDRSLVVTKGPKLDAPPPQWKDPALCLFALFAGRFELATATCRTSIRGTEAAMRMVAPDSFGSYTNKPHRGTVTCRSSNNPGGLETRAFTANGLTKITLGLPHGCTAETDTHIFESGQRRLQEVRQ
jgi:hypothetical protein